MKKTMYPLSALILSAAILFTGCKKEDTPAESGVDYTAAIAKIATHADDHARFAEDMDLVDNDVNLFVEGMPAFGGFVGGTNTSSVLPCDATTTIDTTNNVRTLTVTYNGNICAPNQRFTRTGSIVISAPMRNHFRDSGAVMSVTMNNLQITRLADTTTMTINGSKSITNVTGGSLMNIANLGTIIHEMRTGSSGITVTFPDGTSRNWNVARRRAYTFTTGVVITTTGLHTIGTTAGVSEWGTDRYGNTFQTSIDQPLVNRQDCDFRLVSGQVTNQNANATAVVTFGLDSTGVPTSCPSGPRGHYYMKIVVTAANGTTNTVIRPY
jgi:hypothetical protein